MQKKYSIPIFNLHGGIIPFQVGRYSPIKSIKKGHKYLGSTLHVINQKFDDGSIISQQFFQIYDKKYLKNYNLVLNLSAKILDAFFKNKTFRIPKNIISYFKKLKS